MRIHIPSAALAVALLPAGLFAQGGFSGPGRYEVTNQKSGRVIDLDSNDGRTVIQFESRGTNNQTWEFRQATGGAYFIINGMNGNALTATSDRNSAWLEGQPFNRSAAQQWRVEAGNGGMGMLVNVAYGSKAIDVPDGTSRNGQRLQTYTKNGDSNQRFSFRQVSQLNSGGGFGSGNQPNRPNRPGQGGSVFDDNTSSSSKGNSGNFSETTTGTGDARLGGRSVALRRSIVRSAGDNVNLDFDTQDNRTLRIAGRSQGRSNNEMRVELRTFDNQPASGTATVRFGRNNEIREVVIEGTQRRNERFTLNFRSGRF